MRILHSLFTRGIGGTERHLAQLANGQVAAGHEVAILLRKGRKPGGMADPFPDWLDSRIRLIPIAHNFPLPVMCWHLSRYRPDVIHSHHGRDGRYLNIAARICGRIPTVATLHMGYRHRDYKRHDGLICIAGWQLQDIPQRRRDKTVVIANWITAAPAVSADERKRLRHRAGMQEGERLIATVGRLYPQKGIDVLITAFTTAQPENCRLCIFGEGEMQSQLQQMIDESGCDNIRLMGYEGDIRPWYSVFDLFVMPSRFEPFGLVLVEAMAAGCPLVVTRTAGAEDILQGDKRVLWAQPDDAGSLATALKKATDSLLGKRFDYPQLKNHNYQHAVDSVLEFYRKIIGED